MRAVLVPIIECTPRQLLEKPFPIEPILAKFSAAKLTGRSREEQGRARRVP
jgi:hypothetical protein